MLKDFLRNLVKDNPAYKLKENFDKKDSNCIYDFTEYRGEEIIALKREASLFANKSILITEKAIYYNKKQKYRFLRVQSIKDNVVYYDSRYKDSEELPKQEEIRTIALKIYQYFEEHYQKGIQALNEERYNDCYHHFSLAAESQVQRILDALGDCYIHGYGVEKNDEKGLACYKQEFELNIYSPNDAYKLHKRAEELYKQKKYAKALVYYEWVALNSWEKATYTIENSAYRAGYIYHYGKDVKKDLEKARDRYLRAIDVDEDYGDAYHRLALVYRDAGLYDKMNKYLCHPSIKPGLNYKELGYNFYHGFGVKKNYETAAYYYEKALLYGEAVHYMLALSYKKLKKYDQFIEHLMICYNKKQKAAILALANAYREGNGVEVDYGKALELYEEVAAIDPDYPWLHINLGEVYEKGQGVSADMLKAFNHYRLAYKGNVESAAYHMARFYIEDKISVYKPDWGFLHLDEAIKYKVTDAFIYKAELKIEGKYLLQDLDEAKTLLLTNPDVNEDYALWKCYIKHVLAGDFGDEFQEYAEAFYYANTIYSYDHSYSDYKKMKYQYIKRFKQYYDIGKEKYESDYHCARLAILTEDNKAKFIDMISGDIISTPVYKQVLEMRIGQIVLIDENKNVTAVSQDNDIVQQMMSMYQ